MEEGRGELLGRAPHLIARCTLGSYLPSAGRTTPEMGINIRASHSRSLARSD